MKIVEGNIHDLFNETKIAIGISTGALIEAACLAIPTIIIPHPTKYSLLFFKNYGKGIIWDQVDYYNSLTDLVSKFDRSVKEKQSELIESSNLYRSLYLCKYNETEIIKVYGLG
jgi:UDP-N-acetylglucosamine:LPS N-acetylglucosamine transferase